MPLAGIREDAMLVSFNPQRKSPLAGSVESASRVLNNGGDIQVLNHVAILGVGRRLPKLVEFTRPLSRYKKLQQMCWTSHSGADRKGLPDDQGLGP
jgi:hypothetical protein